MKKLFKVKTPVTHFSGVRHGVTFYNGQSIAELSEQVAREFESWGYVVEEIVTEEQPQPKKPTKKDE